MTLRFEIFPADLDATVAFYAGVLRFRVVRDERGAAMPYVALERDAVQLGAAARPAVERPEHRRPPTGVELVLEVDDIVAEREAVRRAGWALHEDLAVQPWGLTDFRLLDPDGYLLRLTSR